MTAYPQTAPPLTIPSTARSRGGGARSLSLPQQITSESLLDLGVNWQWP